jgi:hypothetical protein
MRATRITTAAGAAVVLSLLFASATLASGPATRLRGTMTAVCGGQTYTVVVENGGQNVGAVQIQDELGHAILVSGTSTYTDTTVNKVLGVFYEGHGSGHANQATTVCTTGQTATLADLYGPDPAAWPEGTAGTDTLVWTLEYVVVLMD